MSIYTAPFCWNQVIWPNPYPPDMARSLLERLATDLSSGPVTFEMRGGKGGIRCLLGCLPAKAAHVSEIITSHAAGSGITEDAERTSCVRAAKVGLRRPSLALSGDRLAAVTRSVLAALNGAKGNGEQLVLQVMLGPKLSPRIQTDRLGEPTFLDLIMGTPRKDTPEAKATAKLRSASHGFKAMVRIGASAGTIERSKALIISLLSALKVSEGAGAILRMVPEDPGFIDSARRPRLWPLALSVPELLLVLGWPIGDKEFSGLPPRHPKLLAPSKFLRDSDYLFAVSDAPGKRIHLGISPRDSLQHTVLLGPTGSGKSNAMLSMIISGIKAGQGMLVIDPKSDLVEDVLRRIPEYRQDDVVIIDPLGSRPVGINPFADKRDPALVTDGLLAVFKELFASSWGPRTQDVMNAALLTLAKQPHSTLLQLPALLSDGTFRRRMTVRLDDRLGLGTFWASYEAMSAGQKAQVIAPVMNKLRQFLLRPALRNVLGQEEPVFRLNDIFEKRRIVLVPLNKGLIGSETARLLGSIIVSELWPLTLSRANIPQIKRSIAGVFIDEVQDYLALPTDLADALSQARSLNVGFTIAHQYRGQLPAALRDGVDANARNKIVFGLNAGDAADMARMAPELEAVDFMMLPRYGIYAHLMSDGHETGWVSGRTLKAPPEVSDPFELKRRSAERYGQDVVDLEAELIDSIGTSEASTENKGAETIGRKRRSHP